MWGAEIRMRQGLEQKRVFRRPKWSTLIFVRPPIISTGQPSLKGRWVAKKTPLEGKTVSCLLQLSFEPSIFGYLISKPKVALSESFGSNENCRHVHHLKTRPIENQPRLTHPMIQSLRNCNGSDKWRLTRPVAKLTGMRLNVIRKAINRKSWLQQNLSAENVNPKIVTSDKDTSETWAPLWAVTCEYQVPAEFEAIEDQAFRLFRTYELVPDLVEILRAWLAYWVILVSRCKSHAKVEDNRHGTWIRAFFS